MRRSCMLACAAVAGLASGQISVRPAQIVGSWNGKYTFDFAKAKAAKVDAQSLALMREVESNVRLKMSIRSDKTISVVVLRGKETENVSKGTWSLQGAKFQFVESYTNGAAVPKAKQKPSQFQVLAFAKNSIRMSVVGGPFPMYLHLSRN